MLVGSLHHRAHSQATDESQLKTPPALGSSKDDIPTIRCTAEFQR